MIFDAGADGAADPHSAPLAALHRGWPIAALSGAAEASHGAMS